MSGSLASSSQCIIIENDSSSEYVHRTKIDASHSQFAYAWRSMQDARTYLVVCSRCPRVPPFCPPTSMAHLFRHTGALTLCAILCFSAPPALAHTEASLCDRRQDIAEQCAEAHDCVTRPEVSEHIGYCKGDIENISFAMCDQRRGDEDCATGDVCLLGTIDPHIGVCSTPFAPFDPEEEEPPMDEETLVEDDPTCQSVPSHTPANPVWPGVLALLGCAGLLWKGRHRS